MPPEKTNSSTPVMPPEAAKSIPLWKRKIVWIPLVAILVLVVADAVERQFYYQVLPEQSKVFEAPPNVSVADQASRKYLYLLSDSGAKFLGTVPGEEQTFTTVNTLRVFKAPIFDDINNLYYVATVQQDNGTHPGSRVVDTTGWTNRLARILPDGTRTEVATFGDASTGYDPGVIISPDRTRMAYCVRSKKIEVRQLSNKETKQYRSSLCDDAGSMHFSRDGQEILGYIGFYEGPYDFTGTEEEYLQMEIENGVGYYQLDLKTSKETYLGPDVVVLDNVSGNRELRRTYRNITVKDASGVIGDVLTSDEYNNLPVVAMFSIPDAQIWSANLTADGEGVYYFVIPSEPDNNYILGYYDIEQKRNYYPLVTVTKNQPKILPPVNKENLYYLETDYLANPDLDGPRLTKQRLIHVSIEGDLEVVSEKTGNGPGAGPYIFLIAP